MVIPVYQRMRFADGQINIVIILSVYYIDSRWLLIYFPLKRMHNFHFSFFSRKSDEMKGYIANEINSFFSLINSRISLHFRSG